MKKLFIILLSCLLTVTSVACEKKIKENEASDTELQAVIEAAQSYLDSEQLSAHVALFEETYQTDAKEPEVTVAFTFNYDDVEGFAYDLILFNIKADVAVLDNGEVVGFDTIQVIIDNTTKTAYDSLTYLQERNNFNGTIKTYEDGIVGFLNSGTLISGNNDHLWSDLETSTRFTKNNIKEINAALTK